MACFHPLKGWRALHVGVSGKRKIVFDKGLGFGGQVLLPCGQCVGCRLERSRQWAIRCIHEASLHEDNCFVTLTYGPEFLPEDGSLVKKHYQDFMKRLRARFFGRKIRYFHCGEYGEKLGRPHYHACVFGFDFPDKVFFKMAGDARLYTSALLDDVWGMGFCTVGDVTFESAAYVARYVMKKVTGDLAKDHYLCVDRSTGVIRQDGEGNLVCLQPEYVTMSRRPGLSRAWFESFGNEVYPDDEVIVRGVRCKPPRYYDGLYELTNVDGFNVLKEKRRLAALERAADSTDERLRVREVCAKARVGFLKRGMEDET